MRYRVHYLDENGENASVRCDGYLDKGKGGIWIGGEAYFRDDILISVLPVQEDTELEQLGEIHAPPRPASRVPRPAK